MKLTKKISILLAITLVVSSTNIIKASSEDKLVGLGRYETAIKISQKGWEKSNKAVIVNDSAIADALAVTPFAEAENAPILLNQKEKLNKKTKSELKRLEVKKVYLIGGEAVLSKNIEVQLKALNIEVERIYGENRYLTALEIAKRLDKVKDIEEIAVVNGTTGLSDAVSIGSVSAREDMAIILSNSIDGTKISKEFINSEDIKTSYVIGGVNAISKEVENSLPNAKRIEGIDRNETNAKVIEAFYTQEELNNIYVTKNGNNREDYIIDALAVGVLAAKNNSPVMIVGDSLNKMQIDITNTKSFKNIIQVGGRGNEKSFKKLKSIQSVNTYKVTTVKELNYALEKADANDVINIESLNGNSSNKIEIKTNKSIKINLYNSSEKSILVNMVNGTLVLHNDNTNVDVKSGNLVTHKNTEEVSNNKKNYWDGTTKAEVIPNKNGVYEINDASQLSWISDFVNSGNTNISIKLNNNIDLNNKEWTPIGTSSNPFNGSFDGGNYIIKNLSINKEESSNLGLFGCANSKVSIKNITLDNVNIVGYDKVGSLLGSILDEQTSSISEEIIQNCYVKNVNISADKNYVGGLVGYGHVDIKKCSVDKVNITTDINLVKGDNIGGVIGYLGSKRTVSDVNAGNLTLNGTRQIGGIAGCVEGSKTLFKNCKVEGETSINAEGILMKKFYPYAGGIIGEVVKGSLSIKNCFVDKETVKINGNNSDLLGWFVGGSRSYDGESIKSDLVKFVDTKNLGCSFKDNGVFKEKNSSEKSISIEDDKSEEFSLFAVDAKFSNNTIEIGIILHEDINISSSSEDNITFSYLREDDSVIQINDKSCKGYLRNSNEDGRRYSNKLKSNVRYFTRVNSSFVGNDVLEGFDDVSKVKVIVKKGDKTQEIVIESTVI